MLGTVPAAFVLQAGTIKMENKRQIGAPFMYYHPASHGNKGRHKMIFKNNVVGLRHTETTDA